MVEVCYAVVISIPIQLYVISRNLQVHIQILALSFLRFNKADATSYLILFLNKVFLTSIVIKFLVIELLFDAED